MHINTFSKIRFKPQFKQTFKTPLKQKISHLYMWLILRSDKRDSNPRPSAWEANALPTELLSPVLR